MIGMIIYALVAIICLLIFNKVWPYDENEWHVDEYGEQRFVSETEHTIRIVVLATIWPVSASLTAIYLIVELYRFKKSLKKDKES